MAKEILTGSKASTIVKMLNGRAVLDANSIHGLSASGNTITYTKGDGSTDTITIDNPEAFNGEPIGVITMCLTTAIPEGYVPLTGGTYNKNTFSGLFAYATATGLLKTEQEWQAFYVSNNGNVPYYADTSETEFRVPSVKGWAKADSDNVGIVNQAGLPNIEGTFSPWAEGNSDASGAFYVVSNTERGNPSNGDFDNSLFGFDASRSNSIYGNSDTVTPFGPTVIYAVKAFGKIVDDDTIDVSSAINNMQNAGPKIRIW